MPRVQIVGLLSSKPVGQRSPNVYNSGQQIGFRVKDTEMRDEETHWAL